MVQSKIKKYMCLIRYLLYLFTFSFTIYYLYSTNRYTRYKTLLKKPLIWGVLFLIVYIFLCIFFAREAQTFVEEMANGIINRTPLLHKRNPGQTIQDLAHGTYTVIGGHVSIGYLGNGNVTKIIGIIVDGMPNNLNNWTYAVGNQPFKRNFAFVLYELRAAGKMTCDYSNLD